MSAYDLLAANLKFLREEYKMTKACVARGVGVSQKRYSQWEYRNGSPNYDHLVLISEFYDVGIDNLLTVDMSQISNKAA